MFHMHRPIEPGAAAVRPGPRRYALVASGVAALVVIAWSVWTGPLAPPSATPGGGSPWGFAVLALVVAALCAGLAGYWHARAQTLREGLAPTPGDAAQAASAVASPIASPLASPPLDSAAAPLAPVVPPASAPTPSDDAALGLLMAALPGPAWLLRCPAQGDARLERCNEAAQTLLGGPDAPPPASWDGLLQALPGGLGAALRPLRPGACLQRDGWSARLEQVQPPAGGDAALLLTLQPVAVPSLPDDTAADHAAFSYTVSHDLRAPIRVVEGFTRILKEDYGRLLDRIGNDHLDRVLGAAARMNSMIDALLALSQLSTQPLARQPVNLSQLAGFIIDDLRREADGREVEVQIQPALIAQGDPTLLRMVLENLLGNAWKYSAKCAQARVTFEACEIDGRRAFVVSDNGAGFDMRFADRLFGVFQRLHSASDFPGTGVGLASVRRIVRRHGGDVWAESEVGHGARFYFTLA
jgi:signal transduction histidine kinase